MRSDPLRLLEGEKVNLFECQNYLFSFLKGYKFGACVSTCSGYSQTEFHGILAKRRQIMCGTDAEGTGGCGTRWFTLEIPVLIEHII
jgi:hypothetical protein